MAVFFIEGFAPMRDLRSRGAETVRSAYCTIHAAPKVETVREEFGENVAAEQ